MIIDNINLNHLRLFEAVFRTQSMTKASQELCLTQSGVSQHIRSLEETLGIKLFDRIRQRLIPTKAAATLYERCHTGFHDIEQSLLALKGKTRQLSGTVAIGIPVEFGNNCVMPLLSGLSNRHPQLKLRIQYGYAYEMNQLILSGSLDFAFVDAFGFDSRVTTEEVFRETLILCAAQKMLEKHRGFRENRDFFESLDYVDYLPSEPVLRMWFKHHFPKQVIHFNVRTTVSGVEGVAKLIFAGVGAGVLPRHHIRKIGRAAKQLYPFKGLNRPLKNVISVAYLREKTQSQTTKQVLDTVLKGLRT